MPIRTFVAAFGPLLASTYLMGNLANRASKNRTALFVCCWLVRPLISSQTHKGLLLLITQVPDSLAVAIALPLLHHRTTTDTI